MKLNSSSIGFIIASTLLLLSVLYYIYFIKKEYAVFVDNPSNRTIVVSIDKEKYTLAPNQFTRTSLSKGKYNVRASADGQIFLKDTVLNILSDNAVINPTKGDYYIFSQYYGQTQNKDSIIKAKHVVIDQKNYFGDATYYNQLYIDGFYYGLDEPFPNALKLDSLGIRKKIFKKNDFIEYYHSHFE